MIIIKSIIDDKSINDDHIHFRLFAGKQEGSLGLCGKLCMKLEEYDEFRFALHSRTDMVDGFKFIEIAKNK